MHKSLISMFWMNKKAELGNITVFQKSQSSLSEIGLKHKFLLLTKQIYGVLLLQVWLQKET